jgi:hypothetical protein
MKILKSLAFFSIFLLLPIQVFAALDIMRISLIEGDVQVRSEDAGDWVAASINMPIKEGDSVWAAERSHAELNLRDGTYLRLDENTALEIVTLNKDSYQVYLPSGHLYANYKGIGESVLQVDTPDSSVRAYEKAKFRIDVYDRGKTEISTFRGAVYAETRDGKTRIDKGRTLFLTERGEAEFGPFHPPDDWEKWNLQRDTKLAEWRPPSRYLPEDLRSYSQDLDDNGRWVNAPEYGYVWTPRVVVSAGWAPYRLGRWTWVGGDYVWVSYEPWGWAPYHYGRWAMVASIGWCWVPPVRGAVYWGPGYVGWVTTPTHVSWVPLAPREVYYGRGYYGPHSVNITNVNVTHVNVQNVVYKNVQVGNAVTVVHRDTFVTGRHLDVKVQENPFLREKIHMGSPNIQPERTLRMPVVKEIPIEKRPPASIREIRVRELKENRPLAREREASVMRPGAAPMEMAVKVREGTPPVPRPTERSGQPGQPRQDLEKPGPVKSTQREMEKPGPARPIEKGMEKAGEPKPADRAIEEPRGRQPVEGSAERQGPPSEKPAVARIPEKAAERPKDFQSPGKEIEKSRSRVPVEGAIEKPKPVPPVARGIEKTVVPRPPEKNVEKPRTVEKETQKAVGTYPAEKKTEGPGTKGKGKENDPGHPPNK